MEAATRVVGRLLVDLVLLAYVPRNLGMDVETGHHHLAQEHGFVCCWLLISSYNSSYPHETRQSLRNTTSEVAEEGM